MKIMNLNIFFAPVSSGTLYFNFEKTVINGISKDALDYSFQKHFTTNENKVYLWGIRDAKKSAFDRTEENDIVFFYKEGYIIGYSRVKLKFVDEALAIKLWGVFENKQRAEKYYWPNIIGFDTFKECSIRFSYFKSKAGYDEKFSVRGYLHYREEATKKLLSEFNSVEEMISNINDNIVVEK